MQEQQNMIFLVFREKLWQAFSVWIVTLTNMDNVIPMVLIFVNVKKNFEIFNSMFPPPTALSKSYVVQKIGTVRMIHVEKLIPVDLNAKFQCV